MEHTEKESQKTFRSQFKIIFILDPFMTSEYFTISNVNDLYNFLVILKLYAIRHFADWESKHRGDKS